MTAFVCMHYSSEKVENSSLGDYQIDQIRLPSKFGNPESLKK